ncbi:MAG TPA: ATP-dependent Clp protease proteolytic subunit [Candidatus Obscuribacterales bacterium]
MKKKNQDNASTTQPPVEPKKTAGNRDIFLFGRLENEVALPVIRRLLKLNKSDPKTPINLYINSSGGNGYNADAIIAVISSIEAKVNTICLGHALSGACEILAAGTGERSAYEFATLMFHQTLWEADGDITNLEIQAAQGQRFREAQIELLHRCTGQDKKKLRQDIERDHYMSAREAMEYGIIDKVIEHGASRPPRASNGETRSARRVAEIRPATASKTARSLAVAARSQTAKSKKSRSKKKQ